MANEVKWIKLTTDMFDNSKIKQLRCLPEGNNIVLIWVMLLTMAGKCNAGGMIILAENIPYTIEMLANELGFPPTTVGVALQALENFNMICTDNNCFEIRNWSEYQNADSLERLKEQNRLRVSKYRENKKIECNAECNVTETLQVTLPSYSYSISNSNISNLNNLINNNDTYISILNNNTLLEAIKAWMEYKDERKPKGSNHYTERGMNSFLKIVLEKVEKFGADNVVKVIDYTMSNNWQGVVWDWLDKNAKTDSLSDLNKKAMEEW